MVFFGQKESEKARRDAGFRQSIRFTKNIKKGT